MLIKHRLQLNLKYISYPKSMTLSFVSIQHSTEAVIVEYHCCSIWTSDSKIIACNEFSKFCKSFFEVYRLMFLIALVILHERYSKLSTVVKFTWPVTNPQRKSSSGVKTGSLSGKPVWPFHLINKLGCISAKRKQTVPVLRYPERWKTLSSEEMIRRIKPDSDNMVHIHHWEMETCWAKFCICS